MTSGTPQCSHLAGIQDLVDGLLDQVIELEAVWAVAQEVHHVPEIASYTSAAHVLTEWGS